jgi:hypothetical protein
MALCYGNVLPLLLVTSRTSDVWDNLCFSVVDYFPFTGIHIPTLTFEYGFRTRKR